MVSSVGNWTSFSGYVDNRGTPIGRHLAAGSSFAFRAFRSASADGSIEIFSPGFNALEKSPENLPSGFQTPERSALPSLARGVGPLITGDCAGTATASNDKTIAIRTSCITIGSPIAAWSQSDRH